MRPETLSIIERLKEMYKDEVDALEEIERRIKDIEYTESKEKKDGYAGQSSKSIAESLEDFLHDWY